MKMYELLYNGEPVATAGMALSDGFQDASFAVSPRAPKSASFAIARFLRRHVDTWKAQGPLRCVVEYGCSDRVARWLGGEPTSEPFAAADNPTVIYQVYTWHTSRQH